MILAQDPTRLSDPLVLQDSLVVVLGVLGTIGLVLSIIFVSLRIHQHLRARGSGDITITPVPLQVTQTEPLATKAELDRAVLRLETAMEADRTIAREGLTRVHHRLDDLTHVTAGVDGKLDQISSLVSKILDRCMAAACLTDAKKPTPRSR